MCIYSYAILYMLYGLIVIMVCCIFDMLSIGEEIKESIRHTCLQCILIYFHILSCRICSHLYFILVSKGECFIVFTEKKNEKRKKIEKRKEKINRFEAADIDILFIKQLPYGLKCKRVTFRIRFFTICFINFHLSSVMSQV